MRSAFLALFTGAALLGQAYAAIGDFVLFPGRDSGGGVGHTFTPSFRSESD